MFQVTVSRRKWACSLYWSQTAFVRRIYGPVSCTNLFFVVNCFVSSICSVFGSTLFFIEIFGFSCHANFIVSLNCLFWQTRDRLLLCVKYDTQHFILVREMIQLVKNMVMRYKSFITIPNRKPVLKLKTTVLNQIPI